jgi:hypothetical protein
LFVECSLADPVLELIAQTKRNPSFISPRVAKYWESGLKAKLRTPKLCSVMIERGMFEESSREKINTLGQYPVWAA